MGSTIVLPEKISCVYGGEVFPMPDSLVDKAKLIVYVDSTECSKCRIDGFVRYGDFFDYAIDNSFFEVMLILSPKRPDLQPLVMHLQNLELPYPIYIDQERMLVEMNPQLAQFRTVTVDKKGKVLLVGDPAYNSKIRSLFFNVIHP